MRERKKERERERERERKREREREREREKKREGKRERERERERNNLFLLSKRSLLSTVFNVSFDTLIIVSQQIEKNQSLYQFL